MTPLPRSPARRYVQHHASNRRHLLGWTVLCAVVAEIIVRIHG